MHEVAAYVSASQIRGQAYTRKKSDAAREVVLVCSRSRCNRGTGCKEPHVLRQILLVCQFPGLLPDVHRQHVDVYSGEVESDAAGLPGGVCPYRLTAGSFVQTRRMLVVK